MPNNGAAAINDEPETIPVPGVAGVSPGGSTARRPGLHALVPAGPKPTNRYLGSGTRIHKHATPPPYSATPHHATSPTPQERLRRNLHRDLGHTPWSVPNLWHVDIFRESFYHAA